MIIETKDLKITLTTDEFQTIEDEEMLATFVQMIGSIGLNIETVDMLHELEQMCDSVELTGDIDPGIYEGPPGYDNVIHKEPEEVSFNQGKPRKAINMLGFLYEILIRGSMPRFEIEKEVE